MTTPVRNPSDSSAGRFKPIFLMHLDGDEKFSSLCVDDLTGVVLIGTTTGRIIKAERPVFNAYATGARTISAVVEDNFGFLSSEAMSQVLYACRNAILKVNEDGQVAMTWEAEAPYSAAEVARSQGVFTSGPLWGGEDFLFWQGILSDVSEAEMSSTKIQFKTADSRDGLVGSEWTSFEVGAGEQRIDLASLGLQKPWAQVRIVLESLGSISKSYVNRFGLYYRAKSSSYFFTTKFSLDRGTDLQSAVLVANFEAPRNTEIKVGIADSNTSDWNDYQIVPLEKAFSVKNPGTERIKVGFKFTSVDDRSFAKLDEFAFMVGGDRMNPINNG